VAINSLLQTQLLLFQSAYKRKGLWCALKTGMTYIVTSFIGRLVTLYYKQSGYDKVFAFNGQTYNYFFHSYNTTWTNPRCVEIPIISKMVSEYKGKHILEVGNVLQHYIRCNHDVVDLNEKYPNVINQDIAEYKPKLKYDLVVSISTFEHIGCWEDEPKQPEKILRAIENVKKNVLAPKGKFVLTLPLGENMDMERYIEEGKIKFRNVYCMKRVDSRTNAWRRSLSLKYEHKNEAVVIGVING
jgi:hypothetical protein